VTPRSLAVRHLAPLYCQRPITLSADPAEGGWTLKAFDDHHQLAIEMEVKTA
jgi:3-methylfumaryl-CoA hydratase